MKVEAMKGKLFSKFFASVPKSIWIVCASYALIIATTFLAIILTLFVARVDIDDHINRYMDILLKREELKPLPSQEFQKEIEVIYTLIAKNNQENLEQNKIILQLQEENQILKENSHPPSN